MFESALEALQMILSFEHLLWLVVGVGIGLVLGLIPGLGGITGMAVLLPLIVGMDPASGIGMLIGLNAATTIGDTFPSVLMGVPGTAASQATVVDGYPMARKGLANVALGAAFTSNMIGGIIGAVALFLLIPVARPIIVGIGSPQLFMLSLLGLCLVIVISRGALAPALITGLLGMLLAMIGSANMTGDYRFTGDVLYLFDGIDLAVLAIGLFAIPSVLSLLVQGESVAKNATLTKGGVLRGAREVFRHKRVVVGNSLLGTALGIIPGIGGSVIDWIAYGATKRLVKKDRDNFGKGDIRGVIAPEAANNAKDGGVLVPTLMFGIPGSATAAILLGGLATMGVATGPTILRPENIYLIFVFVWTLALANALGAIASASLTGPLSKLSLLKPYSYAPFLIIVMVLAAYQSGIHWGDIASVIILAILSWGMQAIKWPRPPLIIGFVLGQGAENYLWISVSRYDWSWLTQPATIVIGLLVIATLVAGFANGSGKLWSITKSIWTREKVNSA
ncbi:MULTISPECIES: tripartite tricarboxylate transporter permease [unclassified Microbacterium]|uniref:tripartite tricarboxylate transporter permease n=1 Tax=unclassified Microbacterium TaxID=2609290 RepID=UPI00214CF56A|nr:MULTISPECIES: tripartite tricarboxylate transporter permease [unclassified Microbacterium]MCR2810517.1 tripartite tricarboxylate transporter permease [Microbacterium sp. zg.B185]WIM19502.1 tripartite tricarboxylate transporter permease [Microbacterium sp. zg-B185]